MATTTTNRSTSNKNSNKNQKKGNNVNTTTNGAANGTTKVNTHAAPPSSATSMEDTSREDVSAAGADEEESEEGTAEKEGTPAVVELSKEQKRALFEERDTVLAELEKAEAKVQDVNRRIYEGIGANPVTWKGQRLTPIKRTLKNKKVHYSIRGSAAVEEL